MIPFFIFMKEMIKKQEDPKEDPKDPGDIKTNFINQRTHKNLILLIK